MTLKIDATNVFGKVIPAGSRVKQLDEHEGQVYIIPLDKDIRGAWVKKDDVQYTYIATERRRI